MFSRGTRGWSLGAGRRVLVDLRLVGCEVGSLVGDGDGDGELGEAATVLCAHAINT